MAFLKAAFRLNATIHNKQNETVITRHQKHRNAYAGLDIFIQQYQSHSMKQFRHLGYYLTNNYLVKLMFIGVVSVFKNKQAF